MVRFTTLILAATILTGCCKEATDSTPCVEDCGTLRDTRIYYSQSQNMTIHEFTVDLSCTGDRVVWRGISGHNANVLIGDQLCRTQVW